MVEVNEDFGFYGEEAEETVVPEIQGVTDKVTDFTYTNLEYPCLLLKEGFTCAKHQMKVVSNMVKTLSADKDISLYFQDKEDLYKLGKLSGIQISSFINIIGEDNLIGFYDDGTKLEGSMLYVLCSF